MTVVHTQPAEGVSFVREVGMNFVLGGFAGVVGASTVYPLDLAKTRLQAQGAGAKQAYSGVADVFRQTIRAHGVRGLYRGMPSQLVGISPEKALKLTTYDSVRRLFRPDGAKTSHAPMSFGVEALAGATAGLVQVVATCPYELVKVRLQTATGPCTALGVMRELGARGLFTGAGATLLRDVPFTAVYFGLYSQFKKAATDDKGHLPLLSRFLTSVAAGGIGAALTTPADVLKTQMQKARTSGAAPSLAGTARKIVAEEGAAGLLRGLQPRIMLIAPLFGTALVVYDKLQIMVAAHGG